MDLRFLFGFSENKKIWVLSFVFGGRKSGFGFSIWGPKIWVWFLCLMLWWCAGLKYGFEFCVSANLVWIQFFWVLNFMFIFSKSMAEDPWPKPHGWRSMAETHLDQDLIFSLSKPRWSPWFDGLRGLIWLAHNCVLVYFIDEDWLWVLVFLVFCFWFDCVLGFACFYYYYYYY